MSKIKFIKLPTTRGVIFVNAYSVVAVSKQATSDESWVFVGSYQDDSCSAIALPPEQVVAMVEAATQENQP